MQEPRACRSDGGDIDTATEAVAVFPDVRPLRAEIDDLSMHGFDHAAICVRAGSVA